MPGRLHFRSCAPILAALVLLAGYSEPATATPDITRESGGVLWGGQLFTDADELRAWLEQRHRSYEVWALRHPRAAAELDPHVSVASSDGDRSLPTIGWVAVFAGLLPAVLALLLAARPPTLMIARRRIELAAFGFGTIAAGATAMALAA
jgi:hypothetical protein